MVQRKSKYGTNRRVTKNKQFIVDKKLQEVVGITKVDMANADYSKEHQDQAIDYGDGYYHKYRVYTDSTSYEQIDKKERKKLYKKAKDKEDQDDDMEEGKEVHQEGSESEGKGEGEGDGEGEGEGENEEDDVNKDFVEDMFEGPSIRKRYSNTDTKHKKGKYYTHNNQTLPPGENEYEEQRRRDRENTKKKMKVVEVTGNPNHILNQIEGVKEFTMGQKQTKKYIEKGAGKKNCLYSGDYNVYHDKMDHKKGRLYKGDPNDLKKMNDADNDNDRD